jgi:hypothetical protein
MRVKCSSRSIPKRSGGFVRACFKFLGIELKTVSISGGPDLRQIFALYCGTGRAQRNGEFWRRSPAIGSLKGEQATVGG